MTRTFGSREIITINALQTFRTFETEFSGWYILEVSPVALNNLNRLRCDCVINIVFPINSYFCTRSHWALVSAWSRWLLQTDFRTEYKTQDVAAVGDETYNFFYCFTLFKTIFMFHRNFQREWRKIIKSLWERRSCFIIAYWLYNTFFLRIFLEFRFG